MMRFSLRLAAVLVGLAAPSWGQVTTWTGPAFGDWFVPSHWSGGIPNSATSALVNAGFASTGSGNVTAIANHLVLAGTNIGAVAGLGVGASGLQMLDLTVGRDAGAQGLLSIGSQASVLVFSRPVIGRAGTGVVSIVNGAQFSVRAAVLGEETGSSGSIEVNGAGSTLRFFYTEPNLPADLVIGDAGNGSVTVTNGGAISGNNDLDIFIGEGGGNGSLTVTGVGSSVEARDVAVLRGGIDVRNGGQLTVRDGLAFSGSTTGLSITGGAVGVETLQVAGNATASLRLAGGGTLDADRLTLAAGSRLTFALGGTTLAQGGLLTAGHLDFAGTFAVTLESGFLPEEGDVFNLLDFGTSAGSFGSLDLPALGNGLAWDASLLTVNGALSVVPEPSALAWIALGVMLVAGVRLRSRTPRRASP